MWVDKLLLNLYSFRIESFIWSDQGKMRRRVWFYFTPMPSHARNYFLFDIFKHINTYLDTDDLWTDKYIFIYLCVTHILYILHGYGLVQWLAGCSITLFVRSLSPSLSKIQSTFHPFGDDKISTTRTWELNNGNSASGWPLGVIQDIF